MNLASETELLEFFESEPALLDPGVPWAYNTLTFDLVHDDERLRVELVPGYGKASVQWWQQQALRVSLALSDVESCEVTPGKDGPILGFRDRRAGKLQIHRWPVVSVKLTPP